MGRYLVYETACYLVEAVSADDAEHLIINSEDRDKKYFVYVADRWVEEEDNPGVEV